MHSAWSGPRGNTQYVCATEGQKPGRSVTKQFSRVFLFCRVTLYIEGVNLHESQLDYSVYRSPF